MTRTPTWPRLLAPLALGLALAGCGDKDVDEDGDGGSDDLCVDEDLGSSVEFDLASAETEGDDYQLSTCNGDDIGTDAPDWGWTWTAPATAGYTFNTTGSDFDTVLAIHGGGCDGPLLACNDDISDDNNASEIYIELEEGDTVVIVVDGYDAYEDGDIELHVLQDL